MILFFTIPRLVDRVRALELEASQLGLSLNHTKCEVLGLSAPSQALWRDSMLDFITTDPKDACLLGSPLSLEGVDAALTLKGEQLKEIQPRLAKLASHEAFFLLKSSFAVPRLQYLLRSSPAFKSSHLRLLNDTVKDATASILNIQLNDEIWTQASLPVRWGGVGVRDVQPLALSAFISSSHSTEPLIQSILPPSLSSLQEPHVQAALNAWMLLAGGDGGASPP